MADCQPPLKKVLSAPSMVNASPNSSFVAGIVPPRRSRLSSPNMATVNPAAALAQCLQLSS